VTSLISRSALPALLAAAIFAHPAFAQAARSGTPAPAVVEIRGPITGHDILRSARRFMGTPYVWGGDDPKAFDCSGFVQYVFAEYGIPLPRTAKEQAGIGQAPRAGDLRPGDLLFFYGGQGAQHIAIYVGGDTIIHASSAARRVRLDVLSGPRTRETWFRKRLIAVRRVLPAEGVYRMPSSGPSPSALQPTTVASRGDARSVLDAVGPALGQEP
jgi:cell wall-associated NlpC family hydrolase